MIVQERDVHFNVNNVLIAHWNRMFLGIYVFEMGNMCRYKQQKTAFCTILVLFTFVTNSICGKIHGFPGKRRSNPAIYRGFDMNGQVRSGTAPFFREWRASAWYCVTM